MLEVTTIIMPWLELGALVTAVGVGIWGLIVLIFRLGMWANGVNVVKDELGVVKNDLGIVKMALDTLAKNVESLLERNFSPSETAETGSPLKLTELGTKISHRLDAHGRAIGYANKIFQDARNKSPFDIQEMSKAFIEDRFKDSPTEDIKQMAYEHGISIDKVLTVLFIELRDELLKRIEDERVNAD